MPAASAIAFIVGLPSFVLVPFGPLLEGALKVHAHQALLQPAGPCSIFTPVHDGTLHRLFPSAKFDEPLKRYTAWKIGGPADALLEPKSADEVVAAVNAARENDVPVTVLGGGTNVLVRDGGIRGLTIRLAKSLTNVEADGTSVIADAGVLYPVLANTTAAKGLAGLEFATGIPGTVGGAVFMNAGAYGSETTEVLDWADVFEADAGEVVRMKNEDLRLSYRRSILHEHPDWLVLRAGYTLRPGDAESLKARIKEFRAQRMNGSPNRPSCGSTFKRPPGDFPGRVIEAAGLKGTRVGNLEVSPVHANYLVNLGGGTAEDALKLIELVRNTVREKLGVELESEVRVIGEP
ncbi:UDP-N-acetylmuramate dehydrogenase [Rubrobacter tropicus]|uniref:UDP-N-acetylmuramate dehydrogenase n=1 Tax=Rubrobacter tropicus TaxID=2653851 RepID=UPI001A9D129A|nr:UDP-N-acetylmuramate dehydrogenase [Rubrobacter tropicus]